MPRKSSRKPSKKPSKSKKLSRKPLKSRKPSRKPSRKSRGLGKKMNISSRFVVKMSSSQMSSVNGDIRRKSKELYMNKDKAVLRTKKNGAEVTMVFKQPNVKRVTQHYIGV
tara:strand:- start:169 stop:501 length:333 start_codon:yes stop_codon:yes gene_type:complete